MMKQLVEIYHIKQSNELKIKKTVDKLNERVIKSEIKVGTEELNTS